MPISKLHSSNESKEVTKPVIGGAMLTYNEKWSKIDTIIDEMYADAASGSLRSEIVAKLMNGIYKAQKGATMKRRNAEYYYNALLGRMKEDFADRKDEMIDRLYINYYNVYADALENGDRLSAIKALDGLSKLIGIGGITNAIQINGTSEGGVTVNFGFDKCET